MIRISESWNPGVKGSLGAGLALHSTDKETESAPSTHGHTTIPGKDDTISLRKQAKLLTIAVLPQHSPLGGHFACTTRGAVPKREEVF